jgi:hypothetical protein
MQNGEIVFDNTAGLQGIVYANNDDESKQYQFVYNNTVSINVTKCPTITATSSTGELLLSVLAIFFSFGINVTVWACFSSVVKDIFADSCLYPILFSHINVVLNKKNRK